VSRGIAGHLLERRAGAALALAAAFGRGTGAAQPLDQVVADRLELGHVGDMSLRAKQRMGGLTRLSRVGRIGGELGLQPRDLAAKLTAPESLGALDVGHLGVRRRGGLAPVALERSRTGARGVDRARQVSWVHIVFPSTLHRFGRQALEVRGGGGALGNEGAEAVARGDQPVIGEPVIDRAGGVDVHARAAGELAHTGQAIARSQLSARDEHSQAPRELGAQR
jgi:hypothetical protein